MKNLLSNSSIILFFRFIEASNEISLFLKLSNKKLFSIRLFEELIRSIKKAYSELDIAIALS